MVRHTLIRGLEDEEIRLDFLGQPKQDISLEKVLQYVEVKEGDKRSAGCLLEGGTITTTTTTTTAAAASSYKRREKSKVHRNFWEVKPTM